MLYERSTVGPSQHDRLDLEIAEHTVVKLVHVCCSIERGLGVASRTLLPGPRIRGDPFPNGVAIRRRPTGTAPISTVDGTVPDNGIVINYLLSGPDSIFYEAPSVSFINLLDAQGRRHGQGWKQSSSSPVYPAGQNPGKASLFIE